MFDGQRIGLPKGSQPSTHILKPPISAVDHSVLNEGFCLALAQAMGLPTAQAQIHPVGSSHVLLVTRYDRSTSDAGQTMRRLTEGASDASE